MGDIVVLSHDEAVVKDAFKRESEILESADLRRIIWKDAMRGMLGQPLGVIGVDKIRNNAIILPSPRGEDNWKWTFPRSVVTLLPGGSKTDLEQSRLIQELTAGFKEQSRLIQKLTFEGTELRAELRHATKIDKAEENYFE